MSQENVALHRRSIDAINRRDLEALLAIADENVEVGSRIVAVEGALTGHDGIRRWWDDWLGSFPDWRVELIEMRDPEDMTIATIRGVGHGGGSAVPFEDNAWLVARWRDGKCVWWRNFSTEAEAHQAAGVSE